MKKKIINACAAFFPQYLTHWISSSPKHRWVSGTLIRSHLNLTDWILIPAQITEFRLVAYMSYFLQDVVSPATSPLLTFFQGIAGEKRDYSDVIKGRDSKTLWGIGGKALVRPCASDDQSLGYERSVENPVQDESEQSKETWLKIVNGPGLEAVASAPSVGQPYFHTSVLLMQIIGHHRWCGCIGPRSRLRTQEGKVRRSHPRGIVSSWRPRDYSARASIRSEYARRRWCNAHSRKPLSLARLY